jgi:uncharacterized membrane protein YphA (DoxX/SURF4 family)
MMIDPAIQLALRVALSLLFTWAVVHKLRDVSAFEEALENYALLPKQLTTAAALAVICAEIAIAPSLLLFRGSASALAAAALLGIYTFAIAVNLARGRRDIDCGCAGPAQRRTLSAGLIGRNTGLCAAALIGALPASQRALTGIDAATILGTVAFLGLLYGAVDGMLTNAPRLTLLRRPELRQAPKPSSPQALGPEVMR